MQVKLALEDGTIFEGINFGASGEVDGEVVFNTSMTGYQEILTDPSYAGQIVTMTYPHIGNYGVNSEDVEARKPFVKGFIVKEYSEFFSNWRAEGSLGKYLEEHGIVGIADIDTRMLTKHIRLAGAMKGVLSTEDLDDKSLITKAKASPGLVGRDLVEGVTIDKKYKFNNDGEFKVVAYDFGAKLNILRCLSQVDCQVEVVPAQTSADEVLSHQPNGVLLSNGPGDPAPIHYAIEATRNLLGKKPIFGICLGHQILGLALGGETYKLKFGHRGANQPVKNLETGRVEITAQNHGFAVDIESLKDKEVKITHINLNDHTLEGMRSERWNFFSVQYHPEASPGPHDASYLFENFVQMMRREK